LTLAWDTRLSDTFLCGSVPIPFPPLDGALPAC
jgi:hypothetical protein